MEDQGVQQLQQPIVVYPTKQYPEPSSSSSSSLQLTPSSSSKGSFGTVFIVLAVIFVLSVMACAFGRLCNRGSRVSKQQNSKHEKASSKKSREIRPVEREPRERGDMEFGFDMKRPEPMEKPSGRNSEDIEFGFDNKRGERGGGGPPPPNIKHGVRFKLPENGNHHAKGEIRHGGADFQFRPGQ